LNAAKRLVPLGAILLLSIPIHAAAAGPVGEKGAPTVGLMIAAGGRYDDVRMCVATPAGVKGGMALDLSLVAEFPLDGKVSLGVNIPVMRPILFGAAFRMLQFEPELAILTRRGISEKVDFVGGPTLGVTLHYGPDYRSEPSGDDRTASFFAMGPKLGGYFGLDFARPGKVMNFELGLSGYVSPLFGVDDPQSHKGSVIGGMLNGVFRFTP
jgi:hypothetical protein